MSLSRPTRGKADPLSIPMHDGPEHRSGPVNYLLAMNGASGALW
jgi:hypothetical protein